MELDLELTSDINDDTEAMPAGLSSPMGGKHQRRLSLSAKWANNKELALEYLKRQREALLWMESVLERKLPTRDLYDALKSGIVLRELLLKLYPEPSETLSPISRNYSSRMAPWKERENISVFLKQCKALGMNDLFLFCTDDLYEGTNLVQVLFGVQHFMAFSQAASRYLFKPIVCDEMNFSSQELEMALSKIEMAGVEANVLLTSAPPSAAPSPARPRLEDLSSKCDPTSTAQEEQEIRPPTCISDDHEDAYTDIMPDAKPESVEALPGADEDSSNEGTADGLVASAEPLVLNNGGTDDRPTDVVTNYVESEDHQGGTYDIGEEARKATSELEGEEGEALAVLVEQLEARENLDKGEDIVDHAGHVDSVTVEEENVQSDCDGGELSDERIRLDQGQSLADREMLAALIDAEESIVNKNDEPDQQTTADNVIRSKSEEIRGEEDEEAIATESNATEIVCVENQSPAADSTTGDKKCEVVEAPEIPVPTDKQEISGILPADLLQPEPGADDINVEGIKKVEAMHSASGATTEMHTEMHDAVMADSPTVNVNVTSAHGSTSSVHETETRTSKRGSHSKRAGARRAGAEEQLDSEAMSRCVCGGPRCVIM